MPPLRAMLDGLSAAAPGAKPVFLDATDWFYDTPWEQIEPFDQHFRERFRAILPKVTAILGRPTWSRPSDRDWFDAWYPESLEAAAWDRGDRIVCFAMDHQDKETPITLNLRCLTKAELAELAA